MSDDIIIISDRIKELSNSTGTGNFNLDGAATGFSSFGSFYSYNDALFYAITDGTDYEVGSGQYILDGTDKLVRFPFNSSNSNNAVNFNAGLKEVYVTYPGKYGVFSSTNVAQSSGMAFWNSQQTIDYDANIVWDSNNNMMGISKDVPQYALDIGGVETYSAVRVSGLIVGDSGVMFSGVSPSYSGGRQLEPFFRNELDATTGTSAVFGLSGLVDQRILFRPQTAGTILAGPPSGCTPPSTCSPDYPVFRALVLDDIPDLSSLYLSSSSSTIYTAGSGLTLNGSVFEIGNMFQVSDTQAASTWIHQADNLVISGISGVGTSLINNTILIDATAISGYNVAYTNSQIVSVSGWNKAYTDAQVASASGGGGGMTSWTASDGIGGTSSVGDSDVFTVSGVSGIFTEYTAASKIMRIDGGSLSGWTTGHVSSQVGAVSGYNQNYTNSQVAATGAAVSGWSNGKIAATGAAVSGYNKGYTDSQIISVSGWNKNYTDMQVASASGTGGGGMTSWTIDDGIGGSEAIADSNILTVSGVSGVDTLYLPGSNLLQISLDPSGHTIKKDNVVTVSADVNITLTSPQVINGVSLASGDRVLLAGQTNAIENGIWVVGGAPYGPWERPLDFNTDSEASAVWTHVKQGTKNDESVWACTTNYPCIVDTDNEEWINLNEEKQAGIFNLTDAATVTIDLSNPERIFEVTLGGNRTLAVSNAEIGDKFVINLTQDGAGSKTVTWFSTIRWIGAVAPTLTTTGTRSDYFEFICTGTNTYDNTLKSQNIG